MDSETETASNQNHVNFRIFPSLVGFLSSRRSIEHRKHFLLSRQSKEKHSQILPTFHQKFMKISILKTFLSSNLAWWLRKHRSKEYFCCCLNCFYSFSIHFIFLTHFTWTFHENTLKYQNISLKNTIFHRNSILKSTFSLRNH